MTTTAYTLVTGGFGAMCVCLAAVSPRLSAATPWRRRANTLFSLAMYSMGLAIAAGAFLSTFTAALLGLVPMLLMFAYLYALPRALREARPAETDQSRRP